MFIKMLLRSVLFLISLVPLCFAQLNVTRAIGPFEVTQVSQCTWRIYLKCELPRIETIESGRTYSRISIPGFYHFTKEGQPQVPFRKLHFAVSERSDISFRILSQTNASIETSLSPFITDHSGERSFQSSNRQANIGNLSAPNGRDAIISPVKLSSLYDVDGYKTQSLEFFPASYDAITQSLTYTTTLLVEVILTNCEQGTNIFSKESHVGDVLPDFVNTPKRSFNATREFSSEVSAVPWFKTGERMVRIAIDRDGIYRISKYDLDTLGLPLFTVDPRTFRILNRGKEIALYVTGESDGAFDQTDYLEFYAEMNHGERGEYYDLWSDENVYWLSWGSQNGLRVQMENITPASEPSLTATNNMIHLEKDITYHFGDDDEDGDMSEYIEGESWIWKYLFKKDSLSIPVSLKGVSQQAGEASLRYVVKGSSRDSSRIRVYLNGNAIDEFNLTYNQRYVRDARFLQSMLLEGNNLLVFYNVGLITCPENDPTCSIERFYVDWAELTYNHTFQALDDVVMIFDTLSAQKFTATISGFSTNEILGYDISAGTKLQGLNPQPRGSQFSITGAFAPQQRYVLSTLSAVKTPQSLRIVEMSDYRNASNSADYIIVTHENFKGEAERLARYRKSKDNFRTAVVTVSDLYNEFNFGIKHPSAIRDFIATAYNNWQEPKPQYVLILGDASWDAKFHLPSSVKVDYVPSFGNPANDNYFVAFANEQDITPKLSVGRIPCESVQAAASVIDKILAYENTPPQPWQKRMMMVNGGKDKFEHLSFFYYSEGIIRKFIEPTCLEPRRVYRKSEGIISYAELDSIIQEVNRGSLWFNFVGHGGTRIIDVGIERPDIFSNKDRYMFWVTMSCNTAHFAEPFETGLNELFLMAKDNGAICSFGTAGRGVVSADDFLSDKMYAALTRDSVRRWGDITTSAKRQMVAAFSGSDQIIRNTVNQYVILGDPATRIPLSLSAELGVSTQDVAMEPEIILENTPSKVIATIHNNGVCLADSVVVEFTHRFGNQVVRIVRKKIPPFSLRTQVEVDMNFVGFVGTNQITVTLDPDSMLTESYRGDNSAFIHRVVSPQGLRQIFPLDNATGNPTAEIEFCVSNPSYINVDPRGNLLEATYVDVQIARDYNFQNIVSTLNRNAGVTFTKINAMIPATYGETMYWRARVRSTSEIGDWSASRSFTMKETASEEWYQNTFEQLRTNQTINCEVFSDGTIRNTMAPLKFDIVSAGTNNVEISNFADIKVNAINVSPNRRGFNIAVFERSNGRLFDTTAFDTYWSSNYAEEMADYLARIDSTKIVAIAVKDDANGYPDAIPNRTNITGRLKSILKEFGAQRIDSVGFRDSYALLGVRNVGARNEVHRKYGAAFFRDTIIVRSTRGQVISGLIGPASRWDELSFSDSSSASFSKVNCAVRGVTEAGEKVYVAVPEGEHTVSLRSIDAKKYPFLRIEATLEDTSGFQSPLLDAWGVKYESRFPEFGINSQAVFNDEDSLLEGIPLRVRVRVSNAGRDAIRDLPLSLIYSDPASQADVTVTKSVSSLPADEIASVDFEIPTQGIRGSTLKYQIVLEENDSLQEYYFTNNFFTHSAYITKDKVRPTFEVLFDGFEIADNDYVSSRPEISVRMFDNSPLSISDTSSVQMFLDGIRIALMNNPQIIYKTFSGSAEKVAIQFYPELSARRYSFSVNARDASDNLADSISYQVNFYVSNTNRIDQIYPYPNPTPGATSFTFRCLGSVRPEKGRIKIYTVAGRLIKEITIAPNVLRIGFNKIDWDGRDEEGDELANGIYFFKLMIERGGKEETFIERLAIVK